jgi:Spy/CpxP family protein refolding chaperone
MPGAANISRGLVVYRSGALTTAPDVGDGDRYIWRNKMRNVFGLALVAALIAAPAPVLAQQPQPMPLPRAEMGPRAMQGPPLGFLLRNQAELGLTDEQITRLQQVAQRLEQQNQPLLEQLRAAGIPVRPERRQGVREMTPEQRRELRQRLEAHRPTLMQMRENAHTAMQEAREVLTPEQQQRMRELVQARGAELRGQRQGSRGGHPQGQRPPRPPRNN